MLDEATLNPKKRRRKGHIKEMKFLFPCGSTLSAIDEGAIPVLGLSGGRTHDTVDSHMGQMISITDSVVTCIHSLGEKDTMCPQDHTGVTLRMEPAATDSGRQTS